MLKGGFCFSISVLIKAFGNLTVKNCLYQILDAFEGNFKTSSATLEVPLQNYLRSANKLLKRAKSCENAD